MELQSIFLFLIGTVISGILQNRADAAFCQAMRLFRDRILKVKDSDNHDLQRAVHKSYLQATLALVEARLRELKVAPSWFPRDIRHLLRPSEEIRWLTRVYKELQAELRRLPQTVYPSSPSEVEQDIELLFRPTGTLSQERVNQLKKRLKEYLVEELSRKYGELPRCVQEMIDQGWQEEGKHLDWFNLLCAFFREELKQNQQVAHIFQSELLANLVVDGVSIQWDNFVAQLEKFGKPILEKLEQISQLIQSRFTDLEKRLDELLPMLAGLRDLQSVVELLEDIRKELSEQREPRGKQLPLQIRQAIAFEIAWTALLWLIELQQQGCPNPGKVTRVKMLLEKLDLEKALIYPLEHYFPSEGNLSIAVENLSQFGEEIEGCLSVADPAALPYFEAAWNAVISAGKGKKAQVSQYLCQIDIPDELRVAREDLVEWLNAIHDYFENILRQHFENT